MDITHCNFSWYNLGTLSKDEHNDASNGKKDTVLFNDREPQKPYPNIVANMLEYSPPPGTDPAFAQ